MEKEKMSFVRHSIYALLKRNSFLGVMTDAILYRLFRKKSYSWKGKIFVFSVGYQSDNNDKENWEKYYLPNNRIRKDALIVDIGAREGDTALFFAIHGYTNLLLIEPNRNYWGKLERNVNQLRQLGIKISIKHGVFEKKDLENAEFAKFNCEGCEYELDLDSLTIAWVAEFHERAKSVRGTYSYSKVIGYRGNNENA
jgi:hypothetical protein